MGNDEMRTTVRTLSAVLVVGLLLGIVTGCDLFRKTPTPTPTPASDIPAEVVSARDRALSFLQERYLDKAPSASLSWNGENTTPPGISDLSSFSFTGGDWIMSIWVPMVSADTVIYEMDLSNSGTGFQWTGKLSEDYRVLESNLNVAVEALVVREMVLSYRRLSDPQQAPAEDLVWLGERTTPEGSVGYESCQFTAEGWVMVVSYGVARPDQVLYQVELHNSSDASVWRCQVDAQGQVLEIQARSSSLSLQESRPGRI
jgi:hypothetical protein